MIYWLRNHGENKTVMDNIHRRQRKQNLKAQQNKQRQQQNAQDTTNGSTIVEYFQRYSNNQNQYQLTPQNSPQRESRSSLSIHSEVF